MKLHQNLTPPTMMMNLSVTTNNQKETYNEIPENSKDISDTPQIKTEEYITKNVSFNQAKQDELTS